MRRRMRMMQVRLLAVFSSAVVLISLAVVVVVVDAVAAAAVAAAASAHSPSFPEWFEARCGPKGRSIWWYQGGLYDPLTGDQLAHVEGLELVQAITAVPACTTVHNDYYNDNDNNAALTMLAIQESLTNPDAQFHPSASLLSKKIFLYRNKDNHRQLLQSIRRRPYSPETKIPFDQSVQVYSTINTFIERSSSKKDKWMVHGEWPDGTTVWNHARVTRPNNRGSGGDGDSNDNNDDGRLTPRRVRKNALSSSKQKSLEFTVHIRPPRRRSMNKGPDLTVPTVNDSTTTTTGGDNVTTTTKSPPRSALFSFGPSTAEKLGAGARETYHYEWWNSPPTTTPRPWRILSWLERGGSTTKKNRKKEKSEQGGGCSVRYTRYGEGPVWYGPNRLCTLELVGRRWPITTTTTTVPPPPFLEDPILQAWWCRQKEWLTTRSEDDEHDDVDGTTIGSSSTSRQQRQQQQQQRGSSMVDQILAFRQQENNHHYLDALKEIITMRGTTTTRVVGAAETKDATTTTKTGYSFSSAAAAKQQQQQQGRSHNDWVQTARQWGTKLKQATTLELLAPPGGSNDDY